jgi:hypothetical protein
MNELERYKKAWSELREYTFQVSGGHMLRRTMDAIADQNEIEVVESK